jgi:adenylosuccinate synthase
MPTVAIVGLQWGDEGKGKIIDFLAKDADVVVRAQGGPNAGHSVVVGEAEYSFHLVPSGILYPHVSCYVGGGTVINPKFLLDELAQLKECGVSYEGRFFISPYAHVIFPYHQLFDRLQEERETAIGTTGMGIAPCYVDAVGRLGIRMCDLIDPNFLRERLEEVLSIKNRELNALYHHLHLSFEEIYREYREYGKQLAGHVCPVELKIQEHVQRGDKVLLEGAQGSLLDVCYGSYPYVTSSHTTSGGLAVGAGLSPTKIDRVLGVVKAYTTRVGHGPFPTELTSEERRLFLSPKEAREVGTTTGRTRRLGWFDAMIVRHAVRLSGVNSLALMKLDILNSLDEIKVCKGYRCGKDLLELPPAQIDDWKEVEPIYETLAGWKEPWGEKIPRNGQIFLDRIEELCGVKVEILSFGPEREKTRVKKSVF